MPEIAQKTVMIREPEFGNMQTFEAGEELPEWASKHLAERAPRERKVTEPVDKLAEDRARIEAARALVEQADADEAAAKAAAEAAANEAPPVDQAAADAAAAQAAAEKAAAERAAKEAATAEPQPTPPDTPAPVDLSAMSAAELIAHTAVGEVEAVAVLDYELAQDKPRVTVTEAAEKALA